MSRLFVSRRNSLSLEPGIAGRAGRNKQNTRVQGIFFYRMKTIIDTLFAGGALAGLLWGALAVAADTAAPTLPELIEFAVRQHPDAGLPAAVRGQSVAIGRQAGAWFAGDAGVVLHHESDAVADDKGFRNWEGGVELPLWLPGQRGARRQEAATAGQEADAIERAQKWRVAGEIRELVWSIRMARVERDLARDALDSARALEADVEKRHDAGELARADFVLAQRETLARELDLTVAASAHDALLERYRLLTGFGVLPHSIDETAVAADGVELEHPALAEARAAAERVRAERDRARGERRASPVLMLGGKSERPDAGASYDTALVLELGLPLGATGQAAPRLAEAERRLTEQSSAYARALRDVESALIDARAERARTERAGELAGRERELAAEGLRLRKRAFDLGESDLFTLLQARTQALASERDYRLRELERGRAIARYNQALGALPE